MVFPLVSPTIYIGLLSVRLTSQKCMLWSFDAPSLKSTQDVSFYGDLLKREELHLDDEKLKEFFPLEGTIDRILEVRDD